jgi:hypothetical protein
MIINRPHLPGSSHFRDIVYTPDEVAPTLCGVTCGGGYNNQPKVLIEYE